MHTAKSGSRNGPQLGDKYSQLAQQMLAKLALHTVLLQTAGQAIHIVVTAFKCQLSCL